MRVRHTRRLAGRRLIPVLSCGAVCMFQAGCQKPQPVTDRNSFIAGDGEVEVDQVASPIVPDHPLRDRMKGRWGSDGEFLVGVVPRSGDRFELDIAAGDGWVVVVNNVRWSEDALCFDVYHYYTKDIGIPGGHPFNGVVVEYELRATDNPNELTESALSEHIAEPLTTTLQRLN